MARRFKIKPEIKNPQDVAAALDRQEIRRVVREAGKDRHVILQTNDPRIMEAVLTAPPVLSGIPEALHTQLLDQFATVLTGLAVAARSGDAGRFHAAPRLTPRRRLDETTAARRPVLRWRPEPVARQAAE